MTLSKPSEEKTTLATNSNLQKTLEVVFILDITGSMSNQIAGVKQMISEFCKTDRTGVNVHIFTFTENSKCCYVTKSPPGLQSAQLIKYVSEITTSKPPGTTGITAAGDDGPENITAALASLLSSFKVTDNILSFIITDDAPHHKSFGASATTEAEKQWLTENGFETHDIFALLNTVIESLNITIVPVLYGSATLYKWYQQAAILSDGLVLCPESNESRILAAGLGCILDAVQRMSLSSFIDRESVAQMAEVCNGFSVLGLNVDTFEPLQNDPERIDDCKLHVEKKKSADEIKASLLGLLETTFNRFSGKKSSKRCRSVDANVIAASVRVLVMSMLDVIDSPLLVKKDFNESVAKLLEILDKNKAENEIKLINKWIENIGKVKDSLKLVDKKPDTSSVQCLITLNSALEYLSGLEQVPATEEEVAAWMEIVLQLTMCRLVNISFPLDFYGKPDFMDAWAASIRSIELGTVLTASSAAKLRNLDSGVYVDPVSRRENTAAMIVAHPNDMVLSAIYKCLSYLPSLLGLIQSYLVSGNFKIFPSITHGLQAACVLWMLRSCSEDYNHAEWELLRCLAWSLMLSVDTPAVGVVRQLRKEKLLNPVDNLAKILAGFMIFMAKDGENLDVGDKRNVLKCLFEELSADMVMFIYRKREKSDGNDGLLSDEEFVKCFVDCVDEDFDAIKSLHEAEKICKKSIELPKSGFDKLKEVVKACKTFKRAGEVFNKFCDLIQCDLKMEDCKEAFKVVEDLEGEKRFSQMLGYDERADIFAQSVVLRKRTGRYKLDDASEWKKILDAGEMRENLESICIDSIEKIYRVKFVEWAAKRREFAREKLIRKVMDIDVESSEMANEELEKISFKLLEVSYKLGRMDALIILDKLRNDVKKLKTVGLAFCLGKWTSEPPSQLRRSCMTVLEFFEGQPDLQACLKSEIMKKEVCCREKANRHGHSKDNIYPGALGWTQEYHDKRLSTVYDNEKIKRTLEKMKSDVEYVNQIREEMIDDEFGANRQKIVEVLMRFDYESCQIDALRLLLEFIRKRKEIGEHADDKLFKDIVEKIRCKKTIKNMPKFFEDIKKMLK